MKRNLNVEKGQPIRIIFLNAILKKYLNFNYKNIAKKMTDSWVFSQNASLKRTRF